MLCLDVPDPPENVKCNGVGEDTASIEWEPPKFDGGVPVKGKPHPQLFNLAIFCLWIIFNFFAIQRKSKKLSWKILNKITWNCDKSEI